jgi:hypothetical protein
VLQDELDRRRPQLVQRINRALEKHRDDLRLSPNELVARSLGRLFLPSSNPSSSGPMPAPDNSLDANTTGVGRDHPVPLTRHND